MRLAVIEDEGRRQTGVMSCDRFTPLAEPHGSWDPVAVAGVPDRRVLALDAAAAPLGAAAFLAIASPTAVFCAEDNYRCQPRPRRAGLALQRPPVLQPFLTGDAIEDVLITAADPCAVCVDGSDVILPRGCERLDVGITLAAIVGRRGDAGIVAYAAALDFVRCDVPQTQPYLARSFPTHKVVGRTLVTVDELPRIGDLKLELRVDGHLRQRGTTANLIAGPEQLLSTIERRYPLQPGDLILTGTPAGTAADRGEGWLRSGAVIEGEISGLGAVRVRIVDEQPGV